jgi:effector-binding domain-containing protein
MPSYHVARTVEISASPQQVFDVVSDFGTWTSWSPWLTADPDAKITVSSPANQTGSSYAWEGEVTGQGELRHLKLIPGKLVDDELRFIKPFKTTCATSFELQPTSTGTRLTWNMQGSMPWFMFWMIPMMKTFIGMDYQRGLGMIKDWVETGSIPSRVDVRGAEQVGPLRIAGIADAAPVDAVGKKMDQSFVEARAEFSTFGLKPGTPVSVYTRFRVKQGVFDYLSGFELSPGQQLPIGTRLKLWELPAVQAFHVRHTGSYRHLGNGWSVANQIVRHRKLKQRNCGTFEIYRNWPGEVSESELVTDIYLPLK